jgi:hypothetical protein
MGVSSLAQARSQFIKDKDVFISLSQHQFKPGYYLNTIIQ